jgi:hypothetical protein
MRKTWLCGALALAAIAPSAIADEKVIEPDAFKGEILKSIVGARHIWHVARISSPGKSALYARWCTPILRPPHLSCTKPWKLLQFPAGRHELASAGILSGGTLVVISDKGMMSRCLFDSRPCGQAINIRK